MTQLPTEPTKPEKIEMLVETIDSLAIARAKQRVSEFCENAPGAVYHAETAAKARQLLKQQLELML